MRGIVAKYGSENAECLVFTYKDGLFATMAHDLKLRATRFNLEVDDVSKAIEATIDAASLRVVCCVQNGEEKNDVLSEKDKRAIQRKIVDEVLHAHEHPQIAFVSTEVEESGLGYEIKGTISLHGKKTPIEVSAVKNDSNTTAEFSLHQPDFGIKPFSAMLGALKVKPDVDVRVSVPS